MVIVAVYAAANGGGVGAGVVRYVCDEKQKSEEVGDLLIECVQ